MKPLMSRALIALGALLVFGALNFAIYGKEHIRRGGEAVYLPLAPVDPRSLIQGDYMALRFAIVRDIEGREGREGRHDPSTREGSVSFAPIVLDGRRVAGLAADGAAPALKLRYRIRNGRVWLGTNAFFFEEGTAERFGKARYGEFRVDAISGEAVLVGLRDADLKAL
jgi:uncharacterized membrane-anchored protein